MTWPICFTYRWRTIAAAGCFAFTAVALPTFGITQVPDELPFRPGERLTYSVRLSRFGTVGKATMSLEGPVSIRGLAAYALRFELRARVGPFTATERTESWVDLAQMASLRFSKEERSPFARRDEAVEIFLDSGRWQASDGTEGEVTAAAPLDELSFIYFIRTLVLKPDSLYEFNRHFDILRNPTTLRLLKRDTITTAAGRFPVTLVEMRVRDSRRYKEEGIIRIYLSEDDMRLPVRIESVMPVGRMTVLTLDSHISPRAHHAYLEQPNIFFPRPD